MPDVRDERIWVDRIATFKKFANAIGAELDYKIFPGGKERCVVTQYFRPRKEQEVRGDQNND